MSKLRLTGIDGINGGEEDKHSFQLPNLIDAIET